VNAGLARVRDGEGAMDKIGLLIPQFPSQTHIAMWRVGNAMRELGADVRFISTRLPPADERVHTELTRESRNTVYVWPPRLARALAALAREPLGLLRCLRYVAGLSESTWIERCRQLPMILAAGDLREVCRAEGIGHIFVHSCADAAHLVNLCRRLGGPGFSLRLGGDLDVYGKDHRSKMERAEFIVPAARVNLEEIVERVGVPRSRLFWTWLGVDTERFAPRAGEVCAEDALRIVTVGRLNAAKGHAYVLGAIRLLADRGVRVHYSIAGSGSHRAEIERDVDRLGLDACVEFRGGLDESAIVALLQESDVFVLASVGRGEASPVALIEAMSCGLPVVSTIIGGTADMLTDGEEGLLVPQADAAALADAIGSLAADPDLRDRMGRAARERALGEFECASVARRVLQAIDGANPNRNPRRPAR